MKRSIRIPITGAAAALSCLLALAAFTPARALFGRDDAVSAVAAFAKSDITGTTICFSEEDFVSRVTGKDELTGIVVSELPESGALRLAGRALLRGESVSCAQLGTLSYAAAEDESETHARFSFIPVFRRGGAAAEAVSVSLNLSAEKNLSPVARDLTLPTYAGVALCGTLRAVDAENDRCTFDLADAPRRGTVEVDGDTFVYTPADGKTGADRFTYTATDACGNVSDAATVTVEVEKRARGDDFTYTDMADSTAHYAALRLRDAGAFCGETLGADSFFCPDRAVSRAEFVALVSAVTESALPTAAVGTGLADNESIPVWAQPYVAAAVVGGVVQGERDGSGNRVFRAQDAITRAEAAAIMARALDLPDDGRAMAFSDAAGVPAWAAQDVVNCTAAQVLPVFGDNTVRCGAAVTRADAAEMLCAMLDYRAAWEPTGLLGLFA